MKEYLASSIVVGLSAIAANWSMNPFVALAALPTVSTDAIAQQSNNLTISQSNSSVLFYCVTESGKEISLYDFGDRIEYSFGVAGQPEIVLSRTREEASTYQWAGVGRSIHYSVDVPNGDTVYSVFWSFDRLSSQREETGGVTVAINGEHAATVPRGSGDIVQNLEGVDLPPTRY